ncbi:MAG: hybrid sensor histidine kinase/response regulator, partial [Leptolyngbya sp. DLM2.Bin27]
MPNPPHIRDQAYQFFLEEAPELLQTIEAGLLALRSQRDIAEIHQIMRAAHSLKGGAASVGLEPIKALAHRLEALFKALYSETLVVDGELENQLLQAFDCLRLPLTQQLTQGSFDGDQALALAEPVLHNLEQRLASAMAETENFIPSSSDLGFDMATSIFEIDVQQGLDHLAGVLAQPQAHEVAGELRAQAEIFMGFAELLDLSGFAQIAETTLQALTTNPEQAIEITRLAIADFSQGRAAVLAAKSTTGGAPSAALQALAAPASLPQLPLEPVAEQALTAVFGDPDFGDPDLDSTTWDADLPTAADALTWLTQAQLPPEGDLAPPEINSVGPSIPAISSPAPPKSPSSLESIFGSKHPVTAADAAALPTADIPPDTTPTPPPIHSPFTPSPTSPTPP